MQLTKTFTAQQFAQGLGSWHWLNLRGRTPRFASLFGDIFLQDESGWWFLDRLEGSIRHAWDSSETMTEVLATEQGQDQYLLGGLAMAAYAKGLTLGPDEIYDFMPPPILGGQTILDNVTTGGFAITLDISGQLHEQVRQLPPGTRISKITISEG
jgi:T6SS immunity protein Tdi1, C-terminal